MKSIYCVFLLLFCFGFMNAQQYYLTPGDSAFSSKSVVDQYDESDVYIYFHNNRTASVRLTWKIVAQNLTAGWEIGLCDNHQCYTNNAGSLDSILYSPLTSDPILPGDSGLMKAVFWPKYIPGEGWMKVSFTTLGDTTATYELTYKTTASIANGISSIDKDGLSVNVIPNPANDKVFLKELSTNHPVLIQIMNLEGRLIKTINGTGTEDMIIDIGSLTSGLYLVKVNDLVSQSTSIRKLSKL